MKKLIPTAASLLIAFNLSAQRPQEEIQSSELLYQKVKKPTMAIPQGPDGETPASPVRVGRLKTITPARKAITLTPAQQLIVTEADAPNMATRSLTTICASPVVDEELEPVYESVKAHMPLYLPYKNAKAGVWQGFYYSWDKNGDGAKDLHAAIDYGKTSVDANEDPTFAIYAIAPGKVIDVRWNNGGGNTVVIEHTAPDGYKYRSTYLHLRNGYDNDRANAKNSPTDKYKKFANNGTSSQLCWGTNAQTIKVKVNDNVQAGQFIAYAGNTGSGGIGVILDDDGTFTSSAEGTRSYNVHLHFEVSVKDTRAGHTNEWVNVDPYGAYNHAGVDCYDRRQTVRSHAFMRRFIPASTTFRWTW
ncbi:M23 family metallopeptidase [Chitinophaga sedimenti]|uniref:M23 family metallopeptidase n=1 Tax=Chitinophaga sedimenti TaxID=2033606 RepID=UPI002004029C|nr:M23 family metallopeptidase [Chitinophaga sedimenti]MCK7554331.1 M23 family metallopeptidase [Chitinophaga sedimenti]